VRDLRAATRLTDATGRRSESAVRTLAFGTSVALRDDRWSRPSRA